MQAIRESVYSQCLLTVPIITFGGSGAFGNWADVGKKGEQLINNFVSVAQVRSQKGCPVTSFRQLTNLVADLGYHNRSFNLLFRGQQNDYLDKNGKSTIYPTICRPEKTVENKYRKAIRTPTIERRWNDVGRLVEQLRRKDKESGGLRKYDEYYLAIIQHYGLAPTNLIDLTQSLRVAASFALAKDKKGFVFVLGMPHPQGSISFVVDLDLTMIKLQNVCHSEALRPHYQEGYLVGRTPFIPKKEGGDNLARRMIAKYFIDNENGSFWDADFQPIPKTVLLPDPDPYRDELEQMINGD